MSGSKGTQHDAIIDAFCKASEEAAPVDSRSLCGESPSLSVIEHELVFSMMLWETTIDQAVRATHKLIETFVDTNELRVCLPSDIADVIGSRYAQCERRSEHLVASLRSLYTLHPGAGISELGTMNKRDVKKELHSIEALPRFAASRVLLLAIDAHAFPVDTKLARELHKSGFIDAHDDTDALSVSLEHSIPSSDTLRLYTCMERWLSGEVEIPAPSSTSRGTTSGKGS